MRLPRGTSTGPTSYCAARRGTRAAERALQAARTVEAGQAGRAEACQALCRGGQLLGAARQEEDMWPEELLCGTGRGRASASSQPAASSAAPAAPKKPRRRRRPAARPSFFSLLRGTLSRGGSCKSGGVAFASVAASAARPTQGRLLLAAAWRVKSRQTRLAADREAAKYMRPTATTSTY